MSFLHIDNFFERFPFTGAKTKYVIPGALIYPVLAAFRGLVEVNGDRASWKKDPLKFYEDIKGELIQRLGDQALEIRNPNKLGKDKATWRSCYDYVAITAMRLNI